MRSLSVGVSIEAGHRGSVKRRGYLAIPSNSSSHNNNKMCCSIINCYHYHHHHILLLLLQLSIQVQAVINGQQHNLQAQDKFNTHSNHHDTIMSIKVPDATVINNDNNNNNNIISTLQPHHANNIMHQLTHGNISTNLVNATTRRFRRNQINYSSQSNTNNNMNINDGCPSIKLRLSLLPVELLQQQRQPTSRNANNRQSPSNPAHSHNPPLCECQPDFLGWQITCYDPSMYSSSTTFRHHQQQQRTAHNIPHQLHPAFLLKSTQNQQATNYNNNNNRSPPSLSLFEDVRIHNNSSNISITTNDSKMHNLASLTSPKLKVSDLLSTRRARALAPLSHHNANTIGSTTNQNSMIPPPSLSAVHLDNQKGASVDVDRASSDGWTRNATTQPNLNGNDQDTMSGFDTDSTNDINLDTSSNNNNVNYVGQASSIDHYHHSKESNSSGSNGSSISIGGEHQVQGHNSHDGNHLNLMHDMIMTEDENNQSMDGFISSPSSLSSLSASSSISFQTVPTLFSIKYVRNTMIEIDCDQAAPHYKPAMFQGFMVDEIGSFTLNNCQLPPIPFSVLFHRTTMAATVPATGHPTGSFNQRQRRHHADQSARLRRATRSDQMPESITEEPTTTYASKQTGTGGSAETQEPTIRRLTVNLNTIVDQRTLITLLAGLDSLEELALNYMQLNITGPNFPEPIDLNADSASASSKYPPPTTTTTAATTTSDTTTSSHSSASGVIGLLTPSESTQLLYRAVASSSTPSTSTTSAGFSTTTWVPDTSTSTTTGTAAPITTNNHAGNTRSGQLIGQASTSGQQQQQQQAQRVQPTSSSDTRDRLLATPRGNMLFLPQVQVTTASTDTMPTISTSTSTSAVATAKIPAGLDHLNHTRHLNQTTHLNLAREPMRQQALALTATSSGSSSSSAPIGHHHTSHDHNHHSMTSAVSSSQVLSSVPYNSNNQTPSPVSVNTIMLNNNNRIRQPVMTTNQPTSRQVPPGGRLQQQQQARSIQATPSNDSLPTMVTLPTTMIITTTVGGHNNNNYNNNNNNNNNNSNNNSNLVGVFGARTSSATGGQTISPSSSNTLRVRQTTIANSATTTNNNNNNNDQNSYNSNNGPPTTSALFGGHYQQQNHYTQPVDQATTPSSVQQQQQQQLFVRPTTATPSSSQTIITTAGGQTATSSNSVVNSQRIANSNNNLLSANSQQQAGTRLSSVSTRRFSSLLGSPPSSGSITTTSGANSNTNTYMPTITTTITNNNHHGSSNGLAPATSSTSFYVAPQSNSQTNANGLHYSSQIAPNNVYSGTQPVPITTTNNEQPINNNHGDLLRLKRSSGPVEFELSFGDLLPNLRSLKLESFIDMSALNQIIMNQQQQVASSSQLHPTTTTPPASTSTSTTTTTITATTSATTTTQSPRLISVTGGGGVVASRPGSPPSSVVRLQHLRPVTLSMSAPTSINSNGDTRSSNGSGGGSRRANQQDNQTTVLRTPAVMASPRHVAAAANLVRRQTSPATSPRRFRRQWMPSDIPEKEDDSSFGNSHESATGHKEEKESSSGLVVAESNVHHNTIMSPSLLAPTPSTSSQAINNRWPTSSMETSHYYDDDMSGASNKPAPSMDNIDMIPVEATSRQDDMEGHDSERQDNLQGSSSSQIINGAELAQNEQVQHYSNILMKLFSRLTKLKVLHLMRNDLPYLPDNLLYDSRNTLQRLYLISNKIRFISDDAFHQQQHVETLDLTNNRLTKLSPNLFRDTHNLKQLRLRKNLFRSIPSRLFPHQQVAASNNNNNNNNNIGINKLEIIDLAQNRHLRQLPLDLFFSPTGSGQSALTNLTLNDCELNDTLTARSPELLFASIPNLLDLNLQSNRLRSLLATSNLFARNYRLKRINLSRNQLNQLNGNLFNQNASQLVELNLARNRLQDQLPNQFLFHLTKLRTLNLSHNRLTQLPPNSFITNRVLENLDISHNLLTTINTRQSQMLPFGFGSNLKSLQLSYNNLSQFTEDIIDISWTFYSRIQLIDLSHNRFSGRITVPIFYIINDELQFNLGHNQITTLDVQALMLHEQTLNQFANLSPSLDNDNIPTSSIDRLDSESGEPHSHREQHHQVTTTKLPIVDFKLTGNPIVCDCLLEPLVSYSRRVAATTNPYVAASIFATGNEPITSQAEPQGTGGSTNSAGSRYSLFGGAATTTSASGKQQHQHTANNKQQSGVQVFYQFRFNDLYCAQPASLQRHLLNHVSIGDLLCPIKDVKLCPSECQCHYQSAFKTVIVDCHNRQLLAIPKQLGQIDNFVHFTAMPATTTNNSMDEATNEALSNISDIDKLIIRLDNNQLTNMDPLGQLFQPVDANEAINNNNLLPAGASTTPQSIPPSDNNLDSPDSPDSPDNPASAPMTGQPQRRQVTAITTRPQSQSLMATANETANTVPATTQNTNNNRTTSQKKKAPLSPVAMGRQSNNNSSKFLTRTARRANMQRRDTWLPESSGNNNEDNLMMDSPGATNIYQNGGPEMVLETSEVYRSRNFMMTCELYLDNNQIETISDNFLKLLDKIPQTSMSSTLDMTSPQSALPTSMLAPPVHSKISDMAEAPSGSGGGGENIASGSAHIPPQVVSLGTRMPKLMDPAVVSGGGDAGNANQDLMVKKTMILPSLKILSIRNNRLQTVSNQMLARFTKLIKSSHTKIYLGHNPYNCSNNYLPTPPPSASLPDLSMRNTGDAGSSSLNDISGMTTANNQLEPVECPIGQLKNWITINHNNIGDLDEIYCTHLPDDLLAKLAPNQATGASLNGNTPGGTTEASTATVSTDPSSDDLTTTMTSTSLASSSVSSGGGGGSSSWEHEHPWSGALTASSSGNSATAILDNNNTNWSNLSMMSGDQQHVPMMIKLIEISLYDLCPYSPNLLDVQHLAERSGLLSAKNQQILLSLTIVFIFLSLLLLIVLIYFGDYQTIMAFIYIHLHPIYACLNLNESYLDGDKLYDAFVSYSSADRDLVMELIEKLEQQQVTLTTNQQTATDNDKRSDVLVQDSDMHFKRRQNNTPSELGQRRTNSFQDLNIMNRSTSRIMMNEDNSTSTDQISQVTSSTLSLSDWTAKQDEAKKQQSTGYKLCIHERDWLPGHLISWNIVNSVQNSRRTILILSKEFIQSIWFQVEFHTAYYQMLEDKIDRLIVIVRGELPPKEELDKDLAFLLTTKTYLTWGEKWFWERLHYALPHKSLPPTNRLMQLNKKQQLAKKKKLAKQQQQQIHQVSQVMTPQKPLLMSSIGKDCSNLLLPSHHQQQQQSPINSNSQLLMQTTENLGSPLSETITMDSGTAKTSGSHIVTHSTDSGRATSSSITGGGMSTTRIMVHHSDNNRTGQTGVDGGPKTTPVHVPAPVPKKSKVRTNKTAGQSQRELQSYVDKTISKHFNLSEL